MQQSQIIHVKGDTATAFLDLDDEKQFVILGEATDPYERQTGISQRRRRWSPRGCLSRFESTHLVSRSWITCRMNLLYRSTCVIDLAVCQEPDRRSA
jgi:hypothetical protein